MARVTVEDCVPLVPNRFDLVMMAAQRARQIARGSPSLIDRDDDKNSVVALREIAGQAVSLSDLHDTLIQGQQKQVETDEPEDEIAKLPEDEIAELIAGEHGWVQQGDTSLADDDAMSAAEEGITEDDDLLSEMEGKPGAAVMAEDDMADDDVVGIDDDIDTDDVAP